MDALADLNERVSAVRRAVWELTLVIEVLSEMISASAIAAGWDLLTSDEADDVRTQMREHLATARDALQHANRPTSGF